MIMASLLHILEAIAHVAANEVSIERQHEKYQLFATNIILIFCAIIFVINLFNFQLEVSRRREVAFKEKTIADLQKRLEKLKAKIDG